MNPRRWALTAATLAMVLGGGCAREPGEPGGEVWHGAVAPGTCGIARRIPLPASSHGAPVSRQAGGFVAGPWAEINPTSTLHWLRIDPSGETQTAHVVDQPSLSPIAQLIIGAPDQLIQVSARVADAAARDAIYETTVLSPGRTDPGRTQALLSAFYRGTIRAVAHPALDGQQGLFAVGHVVVQSPSVAVVGASGGRVGEVGTLAATDGWDCDAVLPTAHAGVLSVVEKPDNSSEAFHLLELSESGGTALDVRFPLNRAEGPDGGRLCPLVTLTAAGLAVLALESEGGWRLHFIARDGMVTTQSWDTLPGTATALAAQGDTVVAIVGGPAGGTIVKRRAGQDTLFPLPLPGAVLLRPIPAESGALFLDVSIRGAAGADSHEIVEVICP